LYAQVNRLRLSGPVVSLTRMDYPGTPLTVGSSGSAVLYYTTMLARIAYYYDDVTSPGILETYTDELAEDTRSLQALLGLPETGIVDADTWSAAEVLSLDLMTNAISIGAIQQETGAIEGD